LIPPAVTLPETSLMVIVPAMPPLPIAATSPFTHVKFEAPSDQFASTEVFQLPLPSTGVSGLDPLESQVSVCPKPGIDQSAPSSGAAAIANFLHFRPFLCQRIIIPPWGS
jgi:hypothetical protein